MSMVRLLAVLLSTTLIAATAAEPSPEAPGWGQEPVVELGPVRGEIVLNGLWRFQPAAGESSAAPRAEWGWIWTPNPWSPGWSETGAIAHLPTTPHWRQHYQDAENGKQLDAMWFEREIHVPADWAGRAILADLRWIGTDAEVSVGDRRMGVVDWPAGQVELTSAVQAGQSAVLRIKVHAVAQDGFTLHSMGVEAGMQRREKAQVANRGLIGDVLLVSRPRGGHVEDVFVRSSVRQQRLDLGVTVAGIERATPVQVTATVRDAAGAVAKTFSARHQVSPEAPGFEFGAKWADPVLWDYAKPTLYTVHLAVRGEGIDDVYTQRFGFREFQIEGRDFLLNEQPFRLRPLHQKPAFIWDQDLVRQGFESLIDAGFNLAQFWPNPIRRGDRFTDDVFFGIADEVGFPVLARVGAVGDLLDGDWQDPATRSARWQRAMEIIVKRCRNHPSVIMWGHSGNTFAFSQDMNPRFQGARGVVADVGWNRKAQIGEEACDDVRRLDPTRPVFTHHGGYVGDWHTSNHYLNMIPLQEREEWMSHHVEHGDMPYTPIEFGVPDPITFHRGRLIFYEALASEPWLTEFCAIYQGREAYRLESDQYRSEILRGHHEGDRWRGGWPFIRRFEQQANLQQLLALFITNTWQSWRGAGHTGGMLPWSEAAGWERPSPNPADPRAWDPPDAQRVIERPFVPGARGPHPQRISVASLRPFDRELHHPSPAGDALMAVNGPTLGYIAGEQLYAKTHHYPAGAELRKQALLINDSRDQQPWTATLRVELAGTEIGRIERSGRIAVGANQAVPISVQLPTGITGNKVEGVVELTATIGDREHHDRFPFRVFAATPELGGQVAIVDPLGKTTALLHTLGVETAPWDGSAVPVVVVGREAFSSSAPLPGDLAAYVEGGGRLLVMTQQPEWLRGCGWRVSRHLTRRCFPVDPAHPVLAGLDAEDLRDWTGGSTLVPSHPEVPVSAPLPAYGWHWGNRGTVASAALEKPHLAGWRPLLECEFDLQYSPLLELDHGSGRVVLCTLDLEDAVAAGDPAATRLAGQLLRHLREAAPEPRRPVHYVGGDAGARRLAALGVAFTSAERIAAEHRLVVVGADAALDEAATRACLAAGGRILFLARGEGAGPLGSRIERSPEVPSGGEMNSQWPEETLRTLFAGSLSVPDWPELRGVSPAETRFKTFHAAELLVGGSGIEIGGDGLFGRVASGPGVAILCQLDPERFDCVAQPAFRFTRWRHTRVLAQILGNLGASFAADAQAFRTGPSHIPLTGSWKAALLHPLPQLHDWKDRRADSPISAEAIAATREDFDDSAWPTVVVPAGWDEYGQDWAEATGEAVYRLRLEVPPSWVGRDLVLELGDFDKGDNRETLRDQDDTFWNGERIGGESNYWAEQRRYPVPGHLVRAGENVLAIRLFNKIGSGGIKTPEQRLRLRLVDAQETPPAYHPDYRSDFTHGDEPYRWNRW